jgi:hypothetical protein
VRNRQSTRASGTRFSQVVAIALLGIASLGAYSDHVARGDLAWAGRAEGEQNGRPLSGPILQAVRSYESALTVRPESLEAHWKLLRALYFAGYFAVEDRQERGKLFDRGREVSKSGLGLVAAQVTGGKRLEELDPNSLSALLQSTPVRPSDVARLYFWAAINWGAWSRDVGLLSAVYQGVANRLHRYTLIAIALEPGYFEGGAFRLLGRLHAELPKVPFVSGWVDRTEAIPLVEQAYETAPEEPGNRLLLALTLLDLAPERRSEGLDLLKTVENLTPRASMRIEDIAVRKEARKRLTEAAMRKAG